MKKVIKYFIIICVLFSLNFLKQCIKGKKLSFDAKNKLVKHDGKAYNKFIIDKVLKEKNLGDKVTISPLKGGTSMVDLFLIQSGNEKFVLRFLKTHKDLIIRKNEVIAHQYAAGLGIAPKIIFVDPNYSFILMDYIEGHILNEEDLKDEIILKKIGEMIAEIHSFDKSLYEVAQTHVDRVKKHYKRALIKNVAFPSVFKNLYEKFILDGEKLLNDQSKLVLCPGDLNRSNILINVSFEFI